VISKIEGTGPVRAPQQVRRPTKTSSTSGTSFAKHLDETSELGSTSATAATSSVSGVIGVQEVDDALAQASKGLIRGEDILDRLEELRLELLAGTLSREKLLQLSRIVNARRGQITDPRLSGILDEIDLRAQVEIAKYDTRDD